MIQNHRTMSREKVQSLINNGYEFKFGQYIREGFNTFLKNPGAFFGYILVVIGVSIILHFLNGFGSLVSFVYKCHWA